MEEKERRKEPIQNLSTLFDPRIREKHEKMAKCRMTGILILEKKKQKNTLFPLLLLLLFPPALPRLSANARTPVKRVIYNFLKRQFVIGILRKVQRHYKFTFTNRWNGSGLPLWGRGEGGRITDREQARHFTLRDTPQAVNSLLYFTLYGG